MKTSNYKFVKKFLDKHILSPEEIKDRDYLADLIQNYKEMYQMELTAEEESLYITKYQLTLKEAKLVGKATIKVSGEKVKVKVYVNKEGNLELEWIKPTDKSKIAPLGLVVEGYEDEIIFTRYED